MRKIPNYPKNYLLLCRLDTAFQGTLVVEHFESKCLCCVYNIDKYDLTSYCTAVFQFHKGHGNFFGIVIQCVLNVYQCSALKA